MKGIIFDIQYASIYDGPGLRTCVFFKGCPLRCKWCQNPESQFLTPQITFQLERCATCGKCVEACPKGALKLPFLKRVSLFRYISGMKKNTPVRNDKKCGLCGECAKACPHRAMELIGKETTPSEILERAQRDRPFYETSGGGVTISGGEPTMQVEFLMDTLENLKNNNLHTALETCGFFNTGLTDRLIEVTDLFLFDLKTINPGRHKRYTGFTNEVIKRNFEDILMKGGAERIVPRIPLIPVFNADNDSAYEIADYIKSTGYSGEVHLLPYNYLTESKWEKIGRGNEYRNFGEISENRIKIISEIFIKSGFTVVCNR